MAEAEILHAPNCDDVLESDPLCGIEDPGAFRTFTLADMNCPACRDIIAAQPGLLALFVDVPGPESVGDRDA